jgi:hypothetical protein
MKGLMLKDIYVIKDGLLIPVLILSLYSMVVDSATF